VEEGGGDAFSVSGIVRYNDSRPLTDCYVIFYEAPAGSLEYYGFADVDEATGQYYVEDSGTHTFWIEAWDDADMDTWFSYGDGWNGYDYDQDGWWPTWGDGVDMSDGHSYTIDFTIYEYTGKAPHTSRLKHPIGKGPLKEILETIPNLSSN
jgi:hypothetical protein